MYTPVFLGSMLCKPVSSLTTMQLDSVAFSDADDIDKVAENVVEH